MRNDWKIVQLVLKKPGEAKVVHKSMERVLAARVARISLQITEGDVAAVSTSDEATVGYYLIIWIGEPYTLQEGDDDDERRGIDGQLIAPGTLVAKARWLNPVGAAPFWYTPGEHEKPALVEVSTVLQTGLELLPLSDENRLPANMRKKAKEAATSKKAAKLDASEHEEIMEEQRQRDQLEYDGSDSEEEDEEDEIEQDDESEADEPEMSDEDE